MITLKQQGIALPVTVPHMGCNVPQVGQHSDPQSLGACNVLAWFLGIMRYSDWSDLKGSQSKRLMTVNAIQTWQLPHAAQLVGAVCQIHRGLEFTRESRDSMAMIRMFVSHKYGIDTFRIEIKAIQSPNRVFQGKAKIDQKAGVAVINNCTVTFAATAQ